MTIPNRVTLALVGGFFAMALISGMSPSDMLAHAGAAATVLAVTFFFLAGGWIGGGEVEAAAATGSVSIIWRYLRVDFGGALTLATIRSGCSHCARRLGIYPDTALHALTDGLSACP